MSHVVTYTVTYVGQIVKKAAKHGCYPYMKNLGFDWPEELDCDSMPERGENELCLDFNLPKR